MTIFFAGVLIIYVISMCSVVTLFARALWRERSGSAETLGTVLELTPSVNEQPDHTDLPASARTA